MARTYKDLSDHAVDRVTGGREESYTQDRARRVRHMEAGGKLVRRIGKWGNPHGCAAPECGWCAENRRHAAAKAELAAEQRMEDWHGETKA